MYHVKEELVQPTHQAKDTLTKSTGRALSWNYLGAVVRLILSFCVNILLSRALGPKPFGELAVVMLIFGFGNLLAGVGVTSALIQKDDCGSRDIRFCFTCQMIVGCIICIGLVFSAPFWSRYFHEQGLTLLLRTLSPLFILQGFGTTSVALLNRAQNTRVIQQAAIFSYFVAYLLVAIPMALYGLGVWSMVAAYLVQPLIYGSIVYSHVRHPLIPCLHRGSSSLLRFGLFVLASNLCNWGISNLDNAVVGRHSGPVSLGLYSRAFNLAAMPAESIISNLLQVLLPAFSRVQGDTKRLCRVYLAAIGLVALILLPPFCAMAVVPDIVVLGLYGTKWLGSVKIFQPLALAIPVNALMALSGPLLAARGKPRVEMKWQAVAVLIAAVLFSVTVRYSLVLLSWSVLAIYLLRFALVTGATLREVGGKWREIAKALWPAFALSGVAAIAARSCAMLFVEAVMWIRLIFVLTGAALPVVVCLVIGRKVLLDPILSGVPQIRETLYAGISRTVRFGR